MATDDQKPEVNDIEASQRFEARIGSDLAGFAVYERRGDRVLLTHTEVDPAYEGKGVGSALAKAALDQVRTRGEKAVPLCEFIAAYIERHPAYADLVDHAMWDELKED
jgi:predicted GNAT family acetyltransferase